MKVKAHKKMKMDGKKNECLPEKKFAVAMLLGSCGGRCGWMYVMTRHGRHRADRQEEGGQNMKV